MRHEWLSFGRSDLLVEREQLLDEGKDLSPLDEEFGALEKADPSSDSSFQERFYSLLDLAQTVPTRADYPYNEPSDLESIKSHRPEGPRRFDAGLSEEALFDRIHAAWVGRCAGNLLGKPVEGWRSEKMWGYLKDLGQFPLAHYFSSEAPSEILKKYEIDPLGPFINRVSRAMEDDDLNYTVSGLAIFKRHGRDFTPADIARFWLENIPLLRTFTAERVAYKNFIEGVDPPGSAMLRNPYREWIGAQIRADFWGYAALGNPELAAEFAWRDASISHIKNGIYGEMWVAGMLASGPYVEGLKELIESGLSEIPKECRLAVAIREVLGWREAGVGYDEAVARLHQRWDETNPHHWCHTIGNAQIVALGLLWGEDRFEPSICRAVQACFDTDCNGATVGSILGMRHGLRSIPEKWSRPLNDTLETGVMGYLLTPISELAKQSFEVYRSLR